MRGDADYTFFRLKAEEFDARADAEDQYENIRRAYRQLAENYRKLAEETPPLVPGQGRLL